MLEPQSSIRSKPENFWTESRMSAEEQFGRQFAKSPIN